MQKNMVEATIPQEEKIQRYYGWRAGNYDAGTNFEVEQHLEAVRLADIQPGQRVLDVACGTGRATVDLARSVGSMGRVDALDLTEAMLDKALDKVNRLDLSERVHFKQGNARALPYSDETFDVLYNGYMFDLIPLDGFDSILNEFMRVLKPGGKLVLVNMSKSTNNKTFYEKVYETGWAVMPCRPVLMSTFLESAGFVEINRLYRPSRGFLVAWLWGTEIVQAYKPH
ncbi:MAG TPA: class I SAM-dependent methyltransferase [Leptolinea sp.]